MVTCSCNIVGLLSTNYQGIFSASINGSTVIEIAEDSGTVLIGQTTNNLTIGAYAFLPGGDHFLGASCQASAQASIPWLTKFDCFKDEVHFIPRVGGTASVTNGPINNVSLTCSPGIESRSFTADASSGPATPFIKGVREDGFNLVYTGNPIAIESAKPAAYNIQLGFVGTIKGFLQSFSVSVNPPDVAKVQYSFVFSGVVP